MYEQVIHYHKVGLNRIYNENTFHKKKHLTLLIRQELQKGLEERGSLEMVWEKRRLGKIWEERRLGKGLGGEDAQKKFGRRGGLEA